MKRSLVSALSGNVNVDDEIFRVVFTWEGTAPRPGQFFMVKPVRSSVFLPRPISAAAYDAENKTVTFLVTRRGAGTNELASLRPGDAAELSGPLGNSWLDFLDKVPSGGKPIALIGGGIGVAPLLMLAANPAGRAFDFYAGFRTVTRLRGEIRTAGALVIATEDGSLGRRGRIPDFFEPERYKAVCVCGPEPMLRAAAKKCAAAGGVPCFVSMERRMACGVGACLGCTIQTLYGNRRCCADGPVFPAEEIVFDE